MSSPSTFATVASPVGLEEAAGDQSPLRLQESGDVACAGTGLRRPELELDLGDGR
jgi:hypothetical protein